MANRECDARLLVSGIDYSNVAEVKIMMNRSRDVRYEQSCGKQVEE